MHHNFSGTQPAIRTWLRWYGLWLGLFTPFVNRAALAVTAGSKGPHAIFEFAASLNHGQRRRLRCWRRQRGLRQFDVPREWTFWGVLKGVNSDSLKNALVGWMKQDKPRTLEQLHLDGKVIKNATPAPAWNRKLKPEQESEIPPEQQKHKADKALRLVNIMTSEARSWQKVMSQ